MSLMYKHIHKVGEGIVITFSRTYDFQLREIHHEKCNNKYNGKYDEGTRSELNIGIDTFLQMLHQELGESALLLQQLLVRPALRYLSVFEDDNVIDFRQVRDAVRDEQPRLLLQQAVRSNHVLEDVFAHVRVHRAQRIVQEVVI